MKEGRHEKMEIMKEEKKAYRKEGRKEEGRREGRNVRFAIDEGPYGHDRNEFARLDDHLRWVLNVAKRSVATCKGEKDN